MTELEAAKYLALKQITERWTQNLTFEEKWELYRYLIGALQEKLPEEKTEKDGWKAFAAAHECCGGCTDR